MIKSIHVYLFFYRGYEKVSCCNIIQLIKKSSLDRHDVEFIHEVTAAYVFTKVLKNAFVVVYFKLFEKQSGSYIINNIGIVK